MMLYYDCRLSVYSMICYMQHYKLICTVIVICRGPRARHDPRDPGPDRHPLLRVCRSAVAWECPRCFLGMRQIQPLLARSKMMLPWQHSLTIANISMTYYLPYSVQYLFTHKNQSVRKGGDDDNDDVNVYSV